MSLLSQTRGGRRSENICAAREEAENVLSRVKYLRVSFLCSEQDANGRPCPKATLEVPVPSINTFWNGNERVFLYVSGAEAWLSMTKWKASPGRGKVLMVQWLKLPWPWKPLEQIQRIGEKNGSKRSLLVDGNGIPLSLVVSGAQRHDVALLEPTLDQLVIERPSGTEAPKEHLCADKGYAGQPAQQSIQERKYIPHVKQRGEEVAAKKKNPRYRARRWVVERTHSWLNRYRKLLVRFEKLAASHEGLLELACALIVFRQVIIIHG